MLLQPILGVDILAHALFMLAFEPFGEDYSHVIQEEHKRAESAERSRTEAEAYGALSTADQ